MNRSVLKALILAASFLMSAVLAPAHGQSQAPIRKQAPLFFRTAVSRYYQAPEEQVALARRGKIKDEELPVLFLIVQRGQVSLEKVAQLRGHGASWLTCARRFGVTPEAFYVSLKKAEEPFKKPFGYYRSRKKSRWKKIVLRDSEIINLVNLKFLSEYYKCPPETIADWRAKGKSYVDINAELQSRAENR